MHMGKRSPTEDVTDLTRSRPPDLSSHEPSIAPVSVGLTPISSPRSEPWACVLRAGHLDGAGRAAAEHGSRGVYNVVDDDPARVAEWLPALAQTLGAKKPMRVPRFVARRSPGRPAW
jgi:hypothetical protein